MSESLEFEGEGAERSAVWRARIPGIHGIDVVASAIAGPMRVERTTFLAVRRAGLTAGRPRTMRGRSRQRRPDPDGPRERSAAIQPRLQLTWALEAIEVLRDLRSFLRRGWRRPLEGPSARSRGSMTSSHDCERSSLTVRSAPRACGRGSRLAPRTAQADLEALDRQPCIGTFGYQRRFGVLGFDPLVDVARFEDRTAVGQQQPGCAPASLRRVRRPGADGIMVFLRSAEVTPRGAHTPCQGCASWPPLNRSLPHAL